MKKLLISVDIDDVLADSTEHLRLLVNERTGHDLSAEQYKVRGEYWGYYEKVWRDAGIDHLINFNALNNEMVEDQSHVEAMDEAHEVLSGLKEKYDFVLVTSRDVSWKIATQSWIEQRFSGIFDGLYFTGNRHADDHRTKGELCADLGVDIHIDDNVSHCRTVIDQNIRTILFGEYGWQFDVDGSQIHCRTWRDVGEYLAKL